MVILLKLAPPTNNASHFNINIGYELLYFQMISNAVKFPLNISLEVVNITIESETECQMTEHSISRNTRGGGGDRVI
jgi:hypothetical protein